MPLDPTQRQKVLDWLKSKALSPICPFCGRDTWNVGDILAPHNLGMTKQIDFGSATPLVPLVCTNCGHVDLFAALPMGLP